MVQRVVLGQLPGGSAGLKVSRPGRDVLNPALEPSDFSFNSEWSGSLKIFMSGTVSVPAATSYPQYTSVNFGKTFAEPPVCLVWLENPTGGFAVPGQIRFLTPGIITSNNYWFNNSNAPPPCRIFNNRIEFLRYVGGSSASIGAYTGRYVVLEGA